MKTVQCTLAFTILLSGVVWSGAQYVAYDLGLGEAYDVSEGIVVGVDRSISSQGRAFYYSGGVMHVFGSVTSIARGISRSGVIVGTHAKGGTSHAFSYAGGTFADLGALSSYGSVGMSVNDAGTVVGLSWNSMGYQRAFSYNNGTMQDLGTRLGDQNSYANDVNNGGAIVGYSGGSGFLYQDGVMGLVPGFRDALAINDHGVIVGVGNNRALAYSNGVSHYLGTLGGSVSSAFGINENGVIVGWSALPGDQRLHAFSYSQGTMTDLGPYLAGIGLAGDSRASAVDDYGNIVGYGFTATGSMHAFLLRPVPEPSTGLLTVTGLSVLSIYGVRNRRLQRHPGRSN